MHHVWGFLLRDSCSKFVKNPYIKDELWQASPCSNIFCDVDIVDGRLSSNIQCCCNKPKNISRSYDMRAVRRIQTSYRYSQAHSLYLQILHLYMIRRKGLHFFCKGCSHITAGISVWAIIYKVYFCEMQNFARFEWFVCVQWKLPTGGSDAHCTLHSAHCTHRTLHTAHCTARINDFLNIRLKDASK